MTAKYFAPAYVNDLLGKKVVMVRKLSFASLD
jgi:hypothetical protein